MNSNPETTAKHYLASHLEQLNSLVVVTSNLELNIDHEPNEEFVNAIDEKKQRKLVGVAYDNL